MTATPIPFSSKDNASGQLNAGINASVTSITLKTGNGANFPQPYSSTATSTGSATTLNCTGILATIGGSQVGKWIWNKTDGSIAVILTVSTNSLTTTSLIGGTLNVWTSGDIWAIDPFVATFAIVSSGAVTTYEEALITGRSTDILTVATGGRGYNGTTANSFSADDYVYLFVTAPIIERFKDVVSVLAQQANTANTSITTANTNIANLQTGAYQYVVASGSANAYVVASPAFSSYTAGNVVRFVAGFANTGSATLNVNSLGAVTIKKVDGVTNLAAGDLAGQIVEVVYDGTFFQMISPPARLKSYIVGSQLSTAGGDTIGNTTTTTNFATTQTIPANTLQAGDIIEIFASGYVSTNSTNNDIITTYRFGTTDIVTSDQFTPPVSLSNHLWELKLQVTVRSVSGATCTLMASGSWTYADAAATNFFRRMVTDLTGTPDPLTVDSTGALACVPRIHWITANASNTITMQQHYVKLTRV